MSTFSRPNFHLDEVAFADQLILSKAKRSSFCFTRFIDVQDHTFLRHTIYVYIYDTHTRYKRNSLYYTLYDA